MVSLYDRPRWPSLSCASGSPWRRSPGRMSSIPRSSRVLARVGQRRVRKGDVVPTVTVVVAAYNEESVIARRIENLLELDYPRREARARRLERRVERSHGGDRAAVPRREGGHEPAGREGGGAGSRSTPELGRDRRVLGRELHLVAGRAAHARARVRRPGRCLRVRSVADPGRRRIEQGGALLAVRARGA